MTISQVSTTEALDAHVCLLPAIALDNSDRGRPVILGRFDEYHPGHYRFAWCPGCCSALYLPDRRTSPFARPCASCGRGGDAGVCACFAAA